MDDLDFVLRRQKEEQRRRKEQERRKRLAELEQQQDKQQQNGDTSFLLGVTAKYQNIFNDDSDDENENGIIKGRQNNNHHDKRRKHGLDESDDEQQNHLVQQGGKKRPRTASNGDRAAMAPPPRPQGAGIKVVKHPVTGRTLPAAGESVINASPASSSLSSVTTSMSPRKRTKEDDDFVAIAMRLEQKKKAEASMALEQSREEADGEEESDDELPPLNRLSEIPKSALAKRSSIEEQEAAPAADNGEAGKESNDDDDDFIKFAKQRLRKQQVKSRVKERMRRLLEEDSDEEDDGREPEEEAQPAANESEGSGNESEGSGDFSRRVARSIKRQSGELVGSPSMNFDDVENVARAPRRKQGDDNDSLFDTDDEELEMQKRSSMSPDKIKKSAARKSSDKKPAARKSSDKKPAARKSTDKKPAARRRSASSDDKPKGRRKRKPKSPVTDKSSGSDASSESESSVGENDPEYGLKPKIGGESLEELRPLQPLVLEYGEDEELTHEVPAAMNRFLKGYQQEGIEFLHRCVTENRGAILGDDMGLGKTIQILGLLSALLNKTGTRADAKELKRRSKLITQRKKEVDRINSEALLEGRPIVPMSSVTTENLNLPEWAPVLIIVPASVLPTWIAQFDRWGYFGVGAYQYQQRTIALESVRSGYNEILVSGIPLFNQKEGFRELSSLNWKLIIVDEYHQCKNEKSIFYNHLTKIKEMNKCPIIGLTGTLMQNNHEELFNLVDLVEPGLLGPWSIFQKEVAAPIKYGRTKTAGEDIIQQSNIVSHILDHRMGTMYLARKKDDVLRDELPLKEQRVVFCPLEPIQKRLYQHIINLPEYRLLRYMFTPCDCGVNQAIFAAYGNLRSNRERVDFLHRHEKEIVKRKECCYTTPTLEDGSAINPRAVIWRAQHEDDEPCDRCPDCVLFPSLSKLLKLCSHAALIQARADPASLEEGSTEWKSAVKEMNFAKVALPDDALPQLPGCSYVRQDGIMDDHSSLSGKMRVLQKLLHRFNRSGDRVLIFSYSTETLSLIENFVRARGYAYLRLDGKVPTKDRQALITRYQEDSGIFLFLISTKAGGLGLNLTAANVVVIFDSSYNPSHDEQAEDRAFRIGQKKDVRVYRLVAQGTVEELVYIRQIYKVQLKQETLKATDGGDSARLFHGVQGDPKRRGELFGTVNLLRFKDGSFMDDMWKAFESNGTKSRRSAGVHERSAGEMQGALEQMSNRDISRIEERIHLADFEQAAEISRQDCNIAEGDGPDNGDTIIDDDDEAEAEFDDIEGGNVVNHQDFFRSDRGDAALKPGDEGFEEEMGGESQMAYEILEQHAADGAEDDESESETEVVAAPADAEAEGPAAAQLPVNQEPQDGTGLDVAPAPANPEPQDDGSESALDQNNPGSPEEAAGPAVAQEASSQETVPLSVSSQVAPDAPARRVSPVEANGSASIAAAAGGDADEESTLAKKAARPRPKPKPKQARRPLPQPDSSNQADIAALFNLPSYYADTKDNDEEED